MLSTEFTVGLVAFHLKNSEVVALSVARVLPLRQAKEVKMNPHIYISQKTGTYELNAMITFVDIANTEHGSISIQPLMNGERTA